MRSLFVFIFLVSSSLVFSASSFAHGPTPKRISEVIIIDVKPDIVWSLIRDFASIAVWHPMIKKSEFDNTDKEGISRVIYLEKGPLTESIDERDEKAKKLSYRLTKEDVKVFPVSFYSAEMTVSKIDGKSKVEWVGRFYRGDTGNFPPKELNDEAANKVMTEFFQTGLKGLKKLIGGK